MENELEIESETLGQRIKRRQKQLEEIRNPWEADWELISELVQPRREGFLSADDMRGKRKGKRIYDGTPTTALLLLADGLLGYLISPSMLWFRLLMELDRLTELPGVKLWLQETGEGLYSAFQKSNFYNQMHEYFLDGGSIGTATNYNEENVKNQKIVFNTLHPKEIYISENYFGYVDTVHRKFDLSARSAYEKFGMGMKPYKSPETPHKLSDQVLEAARNHPDKKFKFIHAVFPNDKIVYGKLNSENKTYASIYLEDKEDEILSQGGYDENPYCVWRFRKNSNEWYGRSPAHDAIADILGLNEMGEDMLAAGHFSVKPSYMVPAEMRDRVRISPHGMNYYEDPTRMIKPIMTGINYPIGIDRENKKEDKIRKHFRVDFFLMLAEADRQMTATEIIERQSEKAAVLGATIGRLQSDCLDPLIDRVFNIEYKAGRLPPVPESLIEYSGRDIRVDYIGPLAQAQKRLHKTQGVLHTLELLVNIMKIKPEIIDNIDWDVVAREIMDSHGFPQQAILDPDVVRKLRQVREEMLKRQQAIAEAGQIAEAVPKLGKRAEKGSVLDVLEQAGIGADALVGGAS